MNKRIKVKKVKMHNLIQHQRLLKEISKFFSVKNKQFGNGYFLFSFGQNSVCHFELAEVKDWSFGIWLQKNSFQIFGEHNDLIDKFKPSRTYISFENIKEFIEKVLQVQANPKLYFVDSLTGRALIDFKEEVYEGKVSMHGYQVTYEYDEENNKSIYKRDETMTQEKFVEMKYQEHIDEERIRKENIEADRKYAFDLFKSLPNDYKEILEVGISDRNKNGWSCSPRYDIDIRVAEYHTMEDVESLFRRLETYIHEKNYDKKNRLTYEHQFSLHGICDSENDLKSCDYRYK